MAKSRGHWSIEDQMHWRLDVGLSEDKCLIQREFAGENLAVIRHMALKKLTNEKIQGKIREKAAKGEGKFELPFNYPCR